MYYETVEAEGRVWKIFATKHKVDIDENAWHYFKCSNS